MTKKETAIVFLKKLAKGESRVAFYKYASENCIHHNVFYDDNIEVMIKAIEDNAKENPDMTFD